MQSNFVVVDGARVHCWKAGSGPALLMVHGLVADGANWSLNIPVVSCTHTVYALDMVNMGCSDRVANADAGLLATADWLGRLMDALGLTNVDLVGSSHGGAVCLAFAARYPERVRSMVLFAPANPFDERPRGLIAFWNSSLGAAAARMIPVLPGFVLDWAHKRVYADPASALPFMLDGYRKGLNAASIAHLRRIVRTWWEDMAALKQGLCEAARVPALLIWGERDGVVGVESGVLLGQVLGARLMVLPGVGHLPFVEKVEASNEALMKWFQRVM